jgi:nucleotide-binding universal stress UspA family protein
MGDPARATVSLAAELGCETIVLGTHGRSGLPRVVLGSVAERVVRTARCRVIVVPPREDGVRPYADRPLRRVVCAIDFSAGSEAALAEAVAVAERSEATVTLLHAYALSALADPGSALAKGFERQLARDLEDAARRHAARGARLETALRPGVAWSVVAETARELDADLVVVGTEGRTGMSRFLLGSTAEKIVRSSSVPVMVVPRRDGA